VVGVGDAHRLQAEISHLAASELEPALRPEFTVEQIEGHSVLAVEVNEVPNERKPCFYKPAGLQKGAYIRVGNTNRQMTDYEIFGYVRANGQMANRDYQRLNRVDSVTASRELRGLVEQGLTEQHSTRRWAHYTLRVQPELGSAAEPPTGLALSPTEAKVVAYVRQHGSINNTECRALLSLALKQASHILRRMTMRGALRVQGAKRGARYIVPPIQPNLPSGGPR
jgi:predicted HTH transcriptional regulator